MNDILFAALRDDARIPQKRSEDAGYDIYACFDEPYRILAPGETVMIPTGIISAFPAEYVAVLKERGSTGSVGIGQRSGVIDSGYRGEWMVLLTNHNDRPLAIAKKDFLDSLEIKNCIVYPYEKGICQALFVSLAPIKAKSVSKEEILSIASLRGEGKLGSSEK